MAAGAWDIFPSRCGARLFRQKDACLFVGFVRAVRAVRGKYGADVRSAFGGKPLRHILFYHSQKTSQALWERDFGICHFTNDSNGEFTSQVLLYQKQTNLKQEV